MWRLALLELYLSISLRRGYNQAGGAVLDQKVPFTVYMRAARQRNAVYYPFTRERFEVDLPRSRMHGPKLNEIVGTGA